MATLSIETKKVRELESILTAPDDGLVLCHDGKGLKAITVKNFKSDLKALINENATLLAKLTYNNAGAHNAIYRGKNLGTSVTAEQYAAIEAGTFEDLYIGDYWVINGVNWRIAAFDYYFNTGGLNNTIHHVTIVPDTNLDTQKMNNSDTTAGGYTGSAMYTANMAKAKSKIESAFGAAHLLSHNMYFDNAVKDGYPIARAWVESTVALMSECNVYGYMLYSAVMNGTGFPNVSDVDKSQFPLFAHAPHLISNGQTYWLRNVASVSHFSLVHGNGLASVNVASNALGVRPAFSIRS